MTTFLFNSMENTNTTKQYNDDNKGAIFKNHRKETETQPDYKGNVNVLEAGDHWLSLWVNTSKKGEKYFSIKATKKDAIAPAKPVQAEAVADEDIPF